MKQNSILNSVRAGEHNPAPERSSAAIGLMPHARNQSTQEDSRKYPEGFFEENEPCCFPEFSQDRINWQGFEWNTFQEMKLVADSKTQLFILSSKRWRIEIRGEHLEAVRTSVKRKKLTALSPCTPSSTFDKRMPFIERVEIIYLETDKP